jgi:hypothetical protein
VKTAGCECGEAGDTGREYHGATGVSATASCWTRQQTCQQSLPVMPTSWARKPMFARG